MKKEQGYGATRSLNIRHRDGGRHVTANHSTLRMQRPLPISGKERLRPPRSHPRPRLLLFSGFIFAIDGRDGCLTIGIIHLIK
jgi:hypothetical protein